jgi:hypothetical protein
MPTCFVVMGYGKKVDFATGRTLDLDKTYKFLIKPAVQACGVTCLRADEIRHAGVIDVPMYEQLLDADVVVADLSTANANAFYELGVRHALKPRTTVVIAEDKLVYPFDVNHTVIQKYVHLGESIDVEEAVRFTGVLQQSIQAILAQPRTDSPVYTFLPTLNPPHRSAGGATAAASSTPPPTAAPATGSIAPPTSLTPAVSQILEQVDAAFARNDFMTAKILLTAMRSMKPGDQPWTGNDTYVLQRLALATYKSRQPTPIAALEEARELLAFLDPSTSNDTETLGLWGSIHKRLWELKSAASPEAARAHLDAALLAYERGFWLRNDHYNGINFAFLLNVRATLSEPTEAIADFVHAQRVRRTLISICEKLVGESGRLEGAASEGRLPTATVDGAEAPGGQEPPRAESRREPAAARTDVSAGAAAPRYFILATLAEAYVGLGDEENGAAQLAQAAAVPGVQGWMLESTQEQLTKLRQLLANSPLKFITR